MNNKEKIAQNLKCHLCDKTLNSKRSLEQHIKIFHSEIKEFKCDQCDKGFILREKLKRHKSMSHGSNVKLKCTVC